MYLKDVLKAFEGHTKVRLIFHYDNGIDIQHTDVRNIMSNIWLSNLTINPNYYLTIEQYTIIIHI